ncbi:MAG: thiamine pyrophosphate-binding protein [Heliobacteriaceae bacterium]|nr:thiamine pyrophosphate-binding protein [Heliobacteriaceae bacterium]
MEQISFARAVVRQLAAWGVKVIYGVTGDDILPFTDALAGEGGIRYIGTAHETGAALMASYQAKLTGETGVCVASAAGAVNLAAGLADAYFDGAPVLALTGQVATGKIGTRAKQYFPQQGLMQNFAGYSELITDVQSGSGLLAKAMATALLHRTVGHLAVPKNLWNQQVDPGKLLPRPALLAADPPGDYLRGDLVQAAMVMRQARRPLIVVGCREKRLAPLIRRLARVWGAAVVVAQQAKGVIPGSLPQVVGGAGEAGVPATMAQCDCILLIGSAPYEVPFFPAVPVIQVETDPAKVAVAHYGNALTGNRPKILAHLARRLQGFVPDGSWLTAIARDKEQWQNQVTADAQNNNQPLHPGRLMAALNGKLAKDAVIAVDIGAFSHWFDRNFPGAGQEILQSTRWRSMGAGLPAAIAAQLQEPARQVVALVGDGSLLMSLGELITTVKYQLPVKVIVVNNRLFGLEKDKTQAAGLRECGLEVQAPDFCRLAQACGLTGFRVDDPDLLDGTLNQALSLPAPVLVDVICAYTPLPLVKG